MRRALMTPCLLWLAAACRSPGGEAAAEPSAAPSIPEVPTAVATRTGAYGMFELGHAPDYTMSVDSVRDCHAPPTAEPRRGYVRIGVEVTLEGTSDREVPVNPFYATLRDVSGEVYAGSLSGCEPALHAVRLTHGKKTRGHLSFDVQKTAANLELRYAPPVIGEGVEELRFSVKR